MKKLLLPLALLLSVSAFSNAEITNDKPLTTAETSFRNDPATVISNYIKAVGGLEKVQAIKNASLTGEANFQGQIIEIKTVADAENSRLMGKPSLMALGLMVLAAVAPYLFFKRRGWL